MIIISLLWFYVSPTEMGSVTDCKNLWSNTNVHYALTNIYHCITSYFINLAFLWFVPKTYVLYFILNERLLLYLCRSYLDMLKVIMFSYLFWFVLTIIFITGTTRISIFCMGYLVACFYFLLFGGELLLKPIKSIMHYWDFLIAYNVFVITMKNILSVSIS